MSHFIGSRSPAQCRSQNQKVYKRFRTLTRIVAEFKKEIGEQPFREAYAQLAQDPKIRFITEAEIKTVSLQEEGKTASRPPQTDASAQT